MDDDVFVVSELTIEVHEFPSGRILGFNGTTEWALDSISQERALWLPREDQLRMALGDRFRALERSGSGWHVTVDMGDQVRRIVAEDAEDAYAYAVLELLARGLAPASRPVPSPRPKESRLG